MQTHQSQNRLARLIEQELVRMNQQQTSTTSQCQELLDKTTDLMNAVRMNISFSRYQSIISGSFF